MLVAPNVPEFSANTTPARPHSAPVISHVIVTTEPVRIPQLRARLRFADVARIALPSFV